MIIVHIESGLGNQMLSYCEYLAIKKTNPNVDVYIEDVIYELPECNEIICQWNGYELGRVFGIHSPNIKELFSEKEWQQILTKIKESRFWEKNWNWPVYISLALKHAGLDLVNERGDFEKRPERKFYEKGIFKKIRTNFTNKTWIGNYLRRHKKGKYSINRPNLSIQNKLFLKTNHSIITGQWLSFKFVGTGIERIEKEIRQSFVFPPFNTDRNRDFASFLASCNSVFIHARRGDMLSANGWCYKYGYFERAVKYIKKHVEKPVFVFFTNTGSIEWCKENAKIFGLDYSRDKVYFVDWNFGDESYRDMQLMSYCKHGIITNSTFGWWGAYFIQNPNKITISPLSEINTTYHC